MPEPVSAHSVTKTLHEALITFPQPALLLQAVGGRTLLGAITIQDDVSRLPTGLQVAGVYIPEGCDATALLECCQGGTVFTLADNKLVCGGEAVKVVPTAEVCFLRLRQDFHMPVEVKNQKSLNSELDKIELLFGSNDKGAPFGQFMLNKCQLCVGELSAGSVLTPVPFAPPADITVELTHTTVSAVRCLTPSRPELDFTPLIKAATTERDHTRYTFRLDALLCCDPSLTLELLDLQLRKAVSRQVDEVRRAGDVLLTPTHYWPSGPLRSPITLYRPEEAATLRLTPISRLLDNPLVGQPFIFNPHEHATNAPRPSDTVLVETVRGRYAYHHYMQHGFDDDKWGCAYRSLQTIVSWYQLAGLTDKRAPSHAEVQRVLVACGDKPASFVNSKLWIGSVEVSYYLQHKLNLECRLLHASSGKEMGSHVRALASHFAAGGAPVMIGGGVLAHTIVGVSLDQESGECRFLILDPHYTGTETLSTIISKGWVGWKKESFWSPSDYYNMCLPQLPEA